MFASLRLYLAAQENTVAQPGSDTATVGSLVRWLDQVAPLATAAAWDNVGLLLGDPATPVTRVVTCLTVTQQSVREAIREEAQMIVSHHPVLFRATKALRADVPEAALVLQLARAGIAVASAHTAYDNAELGINQALAKLLNVMSIVPLRPNPKSQRAGEGRVGTLATPTTLGAFATAVRQALGAGPMTVTGELTRRVARVAIVCGAGDDFVSDAHAAGADVLLTGEARYHQAISAVQLGIGLVAAGHHATERPGVTALAEQIAAAFPGVRAWASTDERDPFMVLS
jgi:dinuclear metal center YbgI/SA1388 family protein